MGALAIDHRLGREGVEVHRGDRIDRVDQRHRIGPAVLRRLGRAADVGDIGRQLHDHRPVVVLLAPAGDHFDILGHLAHGRSHAAFCHSVRTAKVQLDPVGIGFRHARQDRLPRGLVTGHHERGDQRPVRVIRLHPRHFLQVHLERPVGNQFNVVQPQKPPVRAPDRAIAGPVDVDHRRPFGPERLPDHAAPAGLERAADVIFLVRRRGRGQPERIGGCDAKKVCRQVSHVSAPHQSCVDVFGGIAAFGHGGDGQVLSALGAIAPGPDASA